MEKSRIVLISSSFDSLSIKNFKRTVESALGGGCKIVESSPPPSVMDINQDEIGVLACLSTLFSNLNPSTNVIIFVIRVEVSKSDIESLDSLIDLFGNGLESHLKVATINSQGQLVDGEAGSKGKLSVWLKDTHFLKNSDLSKLKTSFSSMCTPAFVSELEPFATDSQLNYSDIEKFVSQAKVADFIVTLIGKIEAKIKHLNDIIQKDANSDEVIVLYRYQKLLEGLNQLPIGEEPSPTILLQNSRLHEVPSKLVQFIQENQNFAKIPTLIELKLAENWTDAIKENVYSTVSRSPLFIYLNLYFNLGFFIDHQKGLTVEFSPPLEPAEIDKMLIALDAISNFEKISKGIQDTRYGEISPDQISKVEKFFREHPELKDFESSWGCTLLHTFVKKSSLDGVKMLIEKAQCDINRTCGLLKNSPLLEAAKFKDLTIYNYLESKGGKIEQKNNKGITPASLIKKRLNRPKWQYLVETDFEFIDFPNVCLQEIQRGLSDRQSKILCLTKTCEYSIEFKSFGGSIKELMERKPIYIRYCGDPTQSMSFLFENGSHIHFHNLFWQLFVPKSTERAKFFIYRCNFDQIAAINDAFLKKQTHIIMDVRFPELFKASIKHDSEEIENIDWKIDIDLETFTWSPHNGAIKFPIRWIPQSLEENKVEDLFSQEVPQHMNFKISSWQYYDQISRKFIDLNHKIFEKIQDELNLNKKLINISMDNVSYDISLQNFSITISYPEKQKQSSHKLRYLGKIPKHFKPKINKYNKEKSECLIWQLFGTDFTIPCDCNEFQNKYLTESFINSPTAVVEIFFSFPKMVTAKSIDSKAYHEEKKDNNWLISIDFENMAWETKDYGLKGFVRWIPSFKEDDYSLKHEKTLKTIDKKEKNDFDDTFGADEDQFNELLHQQGDKNKSFNKIDLEEEKKKNETVYIDKAKLYDNLKDLFAFNSKGTIRVDKDNLIVEGSIKFRDQVDRMVNYLQGSSPSMPNFEDTTLVRHIFHKKGDLVPFIENFLICDRHINIQNVDGNLHVRANLDQLASLPKLLKDIEASLEDQAQSDSIYKRIFPKKAYLIELLRKLEFQEGEVVMQANGDNIIVTGTLAQFRQIEYQIQKLEGVEAEKKQKKYRKIPGKGFLAEQLKRMNNGSMHRNKFKIQGNEIEVNQKEKNLEVECNDYGYECIEQMLPLLEKHLETEAAQEFIANAINNNSFRIKFVSATLIPSFWIYVSKFLKSIKEKITVGTTEIDVVPELDLFEEGSYLTIIIEKATEAQDQKIKEEIKTVRKTYDIVNEVKKRMRAAFHGTKDWYSKFTNHSPIKKKHRCSKELFIKEFSTKYQDKFEETRQKMEKFLIEATEEEFKRTRIDLDILKNRMKEKANLEKEILDAVYSTAIESFKSFIENRKFEVLVQNGKKYSKKAIEVLNNRLNNMTSEIDASIRGNKPLEVYDLIYRVDLTIRGFKTGLALFEELEDFYSKIHKSDVLLIRRGTGSGKSTLLPPLLIAAGFERILVTQPRRLPCRLISDRVNDIFGEYTSGWSVAGESYQPQSDLIFMTDGLLKELLCYSIYEKKETKIPYNVIMLDEIHERGKNIDICLALLSIQLEKQKANERTKLILCSATVDENILKMFKNLKVEMFAEEETLKNPNIITETNKSKHILELAAELSKKMDSDQQLLCFLPSTKDVRKATEVFSEKFNRKGYPLTANQTSKEQEDSLKKGQIFFSTTVAETSLTFRNLVYVLDSGKIRSPYYDPVQKITYLKEFSCAESTLKQRKGRLGRTGFKGTYILVDDTVTNRPKFPYSDLEKIDLTDIYFDLLRSTKGNILEVNKILEAVPAAESNKFKLKIKEANKSLITLGILNSETSVSDEGMRCLSLPIRGTAKMYKSVLAGIEKFNCGRDMMILAIAMIVLEQSLSNILKAASAYISKKDGDFMTLLNLFREILRKETESDLNNALDEVGFHGDSYIRKLLEQCVFKFHEFERHCQNSQNSSQIKNLPYKISLSGKWEDIAKALLTGYSDHTFVNSAFLGESDDYYCRLVDNFDRKVLLVPDSALQDVNLIFGKFFYFYL